MYIHVCTGCRYRWEGNEITTFLGVTCATMERERGREKGRRRDGGGRGIEGEREREKERRRDGGGRGRDRGREGERERGREGGREKKRGGGELVYYSGENSV